MDETRTCWDKVDAALSAGIDRLLLYGPSGVGKTFGALTLGKPSVAYRLICTEDMVSADVTGTWMPATESQWEFRKGPGTLAWHGVDGEGGRLVVDEVDRASGDALAQLLAITDTVESAQWRNPETRRLERPGPDFSVVMTTNLVDIDAIPSALLDRFPVVIKIDRPPAEAVDLLDEDLRNAAIAGAETRGLSLRRLQAFQKLRGRLGAEYAAELIFRNEAEAVLDAMRVDHVGVLP